MAANMWQNSLKNVESDNNKILYETLLNFFLQRNGTYFMNKSRTNTSSMRKCKIPNVRNNFPFPSLAVTFPICITDKQ